MGHDGPQHAAAAGPGRLPGRVLASAGLVVLLALLAVLLVSVVLSPETNPTVRGALAGFCLLAAMRPDVALLITTALLGFGIILAHLGGAPPLRVTEVLVVASLAGCCLRAIRRRSPLRTALAATLSGPVVLFATAVLASTAVWLRVQQVETGYPSAFLQSLLHFAARDYFVQPGDFWLLVSTFVILEGLALFVAVAAFCRLDGGFFDRALRMLVLGGAGIAVMSLVRLAEIVLRNPDIIQQLRATPSGLRISPQIPDYIAAGSYFAVCWVASIACAMVSRRRWLWLAAGLPLLAGLYLTGSRSVIGAAVAGLVVLVLIAARQRVAAMRGALAGGLLAAVLMIAVYPWWTGRDVAGELARQSLQVRAELLRTGVRVMATRPVFGVGIDRFHLLAGSLASPELDALFPARKNPHNDFLRFGAELGIVGLALFLWVLVRAARRTWHGLLSTGDLRLAGLAGGLIAFLTTSLFSNPLMVREVSYVFWIALGLAAGRHAGGAAGAVLPRVPESTARAGRLDRLRTPLLIALGALLVCSIPFRATREVSTLNLTRLHYGFLEWTAEPDGTPYRWSGPRARFFVDAKAQVVEIPLSGANLPSGVRQQVELRVDGRLADRIAVGADWRRFRLRLPSDPSPGPRRIDLLVTPTWVPAETAPGTADRRRHGVRVGEIKVVAGAAAR
jgi:hypothetical protein